MNVNELSAKLAELVAQGHGDKLVLFGPEGVVPIPVGGGILATTALLLAPCSLDQVGGF